MILEPDADTEGYRAIERDRERERERDKQEDGDIQRYQRGHSSNSEVGAGQVQRKVLNQNYVHKNIEKPNHVSQSHRGVRQS